MQGFLSFLSLIVALALPTCAAAAEVPPGDIATARIPHVALLLPLNSAAFGGAAEAVKQGFMAASAVQPGDIPVRVYSSGDRPGDIVSAYLQATQAGARVVVGPLTRNEVTALLASKQVSVPTLALNLPEHEEDVPAKLYFLALAGDIEARQIAKIAAADGRKTAAVIATGGALQKRILQAFSAAWTLLGGTITDQLEYDGTDRDRIRDALKAHPADMLFLAMDGQDARLLRPYLDAAVPTYATSEIFKGSRNPEKYHDFNGIQFVDMPWLLQPDHIAVMVYPKPQGLSADMERLYALGIDAWRLSLMLQQDPASQRLVLDGVTGQLELDPASHQFTRTPLRAVFRDGEAVPANP